MGKKKLNEDNPLVIPFGKAVRVGNFKLWRGLFALGKGRDKSSVECLHVSSLDGAWMVRIPCTSQMFATLMQGYATVDETLRENYIGMIITNIYNLSTIPSIAMHDAFHFLMEMVTFPYLMLPEKEMERRMKDGMKSLGVEKDKAKEHISKMMDYRHQLYDLLWRKRDDYVADYERQQAERMAKEPDAEKALDQDAIAEQAIDILNGKEDAS